MKAFFKIIKELLGIVRLQNFLLWAGGANPHVANARAPVSKPFFLGIGAIVVLVALIALVAGTLVGNLVLGQRAATYLPDALDWLAPAFPVLLGCLYGLLVFSLDRLLVATMPSLTELTDDRTLTTWLMTLFSVSMRILIAYFLAHQISILLGTVLARDEIYKAREPIWVNNQLKIIEETYAKWDEDIESANNRIKYAIKEVENLKNQNDAGSKSNAPANSNATRERTKGILSGQQAFDTIESKIKNLENKLSQSKDSDRTDLLKSIEIQKNYKEQLSAAAGTDRSIAEIEKDVATLNKLVIELHSKQIKSAIDNAKKALDDFDKLLVAKSTWLAKRPTRDQLHQDFHSCDGQGRIKNNSDRLCGRSEIGVFTLVSDFYVLENSWKEQANKINKFSVIDLLTWSLIALELLAIFLKIFSNRGRYSQELLQWETTLADTNKRKDEIDAASSLFAYTDSRATTIIRGARGNAHDLAKEAGNLNEDLLKTQRANERSLELFTHAIDADAERFKEYAKHETKRPSAWAWAKNISYQTDTTSPHTLLPPYEHIPSAESLATRLKGSLSWSVIAFIVSTLLACLIHSIYMNYAGNIGFNLSAWPMYLAAGLLGGTTVFVMTSPTFSNSLRPAIALAIVVLMLGAALLVFITSGSISGIPSLGKLPASITDSFGQFGWPIFGAAALFLVLAFVKYFKSQFSVWRSKVGSNSSE